MSGRTLALTVTLGGEVYAAGTPEGDLPKDVAAHLKDHPRAWGDVDPEHTVESHQQEAAQVARFTPGGLAVPGDEPEVVDPDSVEAAKQQAEIKPAKVTVVEAVSVEEAAASGADVADDAKPAKAAPRKSSTRAKT